MAIGAFAYNDRVAAALLPALVVFAGVAEGAVLAIIVVGVLVAYMLDASRQREVALFAVWATLTLANTTNAIASLGRHGGVAQHAAVFVACTALLFLVACWASLQFRFVAAQHPLLAHAAESALLTGAPPVATAWLGWALLVSTPADAAPFYCLAVAAAAAALFLPPLPSSYLTRARAAPRAAVGGAGGASAVQTRLQAGVLSALVLLQPAAVHAAVHSRHLLEAPSLWALTLLLSAAVMVLQLVPRALWWLPEALRPLRAAALAAAYVAGVAALEQRVVLAAFGAYVKLPAPWGWLVVTAGLYLGAALAVAFFAGLVPALDPGLVGVMCIAVCTAGGISIGLPTHVLPFCLVAGAGLALYQESEQLLYYLAFVGGAAVCAAHFLYTNFWFLDVAVGGVHVRQLCVTIGLALMPTLMLPGLVRLQVPTTGALFLQQAWLVALMEEQLFVGEAGESFYPAYLVCATSAMGFALARRLRAWRVIDATAAWAMTCIYGAKLTMLALPAARPVQPLLCVLLAATPPLVPAVLLGDDAPPAPGGAVALRGAQGGLLAALVLLAVAGARLVVFDAVQAAVGGAPAEGVLLGALIATACAALAPLVYRCYGHSTALKRYLFLAAAAAAMLATVRPPLPIRGGAKCPRLPFHLCPRLWDETHVPAHAVDDVNVYGGGVEWRTHWALWLLVLAVSLAALAATLQPRGKRGASGSRMALAALAAAMVGVYLAAEFAPGERLVQPFVVAGTLCAALLIVLVTDPTVAGAQAPSARQLGWLPAAWLACFGLALAVQAATPLPALPPEARRLFPDVRVADLHAERRRLSRAALLAVVAAQGLLVALTCKLKLAAMRRAPAASTARPGAGARATYAAGGSKAASSALRSNPLLAAVLTPSQLEALQMDSAGSAATARLDALGLAWLPTAANVTVLVSYGIAVNLTSSVGDGAPEGVVAVAPLLLMLHQDGALAPWLSDKRRYFCPFACTAALLAVAVLSDAASVLPTSRAVAALRVAALLACLPSCTATAAYLWQRRRQSEWLLLFTAPLLLPPLVLSQLRALRVLAGGALMAAAMQGVAMRRVQRAGTKII